MWFPTAIILVAQLIFLVMASYRDAAPDGDMPHKVLWAKVQSVRFKYLEPAGNIDEIEPDPVYVVRAFIANKGIMPGFISNKIGSLAKIPTGGGQGISVAEDHISLLYAPKGSLSWVEISHSEEEEEDDPKGMVVGGQMPGTREIVYICRALVGQLVIPGAYVPERNACVIWNGGTEEELQTFEVLTINDYATYSGIFM